jgi:sulfide:quinone oxidoreductase
MNDPLFVNFLGMVYVTFTICLLGGCFMRIKKTSTTSKSIRRQRIVVLGGGSAGLSIAARLARKAGKLATVFLVEPKEIHRYQPGFTYVGFGRLNPKTVSRPMRELIPQGVKWIHDMAMGVDPIAQTVTLSHETIQYDKLVVATGINLLWGNIVGLNKALNEPHSGVISVCHFQTALMAWKKINQFAAGGKFISAMANTETKCPGVPQKVILLLHSILKKARAKGNFTIFSPKMDCAIGEPYRNILEGKLAEIGTEINYGSTLIEIRHKEKIAIFLGANGERQEHSYDLLHVVPPMAPPTCLKSIADETGYVPVNPETLQHKQYPNIFSAGDCAGLPTRKTAAAVRQQIPVLTKNLIAQIKGTGIGAAYNGCTCCPIPIEDGKILMMEFGYSGVMPGRLNKMIGVKPSRLMYFIKEYIIPRMYWNIMLKGIKS